MSGKEGSEEKCLSVRPEPLQGGAAINQVEEACAGGGGPPSLPGRQAQFLILRGPWNVGAARSGRQLELPACSSEVSCGLGRHTWEL